MGESQPMTTEKVEIAQVTPVNFWQTSVGILIKRVIYNVIAQAGLVLYTGVINNSVDWSAVRYAAVTQVLYIVITAARDRADPHIPNTTSQIVVK